MKKTLCMVLCVLLMIASASAMAQPAVLRWHSANPDGNPRTEIGKWMANRITELTDELVIEVYANAQLGSSDEVHSMIAMGENIASATDAAWFSNMQPGFDIINGPFFTETEEELYKVAKTDWFKEQVAEIEKKGVKILAPNWMDGSRYLMSTKPVRTPADLKGMKVRVPNNKVAIDIMNAMGATATPMALTEVYTSLQQGMIDGVENPYSTLYARKCQEVCGYLSLTAHQKMLSLFFVSTDWFNSLSAEAQEALVQVATEAGDVFGREMMPADNQVALDAFIAAGVEIIEDVDIAAFREATLSVYDNWDVETYQLIQDQMAAITE